MNATDEELRAAYEHGIAEVLILLSALLDHGPIPDRHRPGLDFLLRAFDYAAREKWPIAHELWRSEPMRKRPAQ